MGTPGAVRRIVAALAAVGLLSPAAAPAEWIPAELQVTLIFKILTYDRQLEAKAGKDLVIGIVHDPSDRESAKAADEISSTLFKFAGKTVKKLPIKYFIIEYTRPSELESFIKAKGINMLYVTPGVARSLADIVKIAQANHITTATGVPDYVKRGVAVGVTERQNKPQILINLPASKSEGSEFDASLLRIATVVQ
ncbi:MAG: YfiR family protein [Acidobacteria bacterium]|nr:YfiR family protein [Acidobacteriota bacterium]